ncbi:MAG: ACP S-malonyltransferase [Thermoleophilaceae bacterium]
MARDGQLAVLFPGQGSQTAAMRELVELLRPDLIELAADVVGDDPFERVEEGTRWAQPAIFCAALAGWETLRGELRPAAFAGHSLGEITALAAARALGVADALRLVAARGRFMHEADDRGGMLAVRGSAGDVEETAARHALALANDNSPEQVVLSGAEEGLEAALSELRERKLRAKRLPVRGAFHSPAMQPAVPRFRALLEQVELREPAVPVFSCVTAAPFDDVRARLLQALTSPVRWLDVLRGLRALGAERFVETGPGKVLTGLVRKSLDGVEAESPVRLEAAHA